MNIKQLAGQTAIYGISTIIGRLLSYLLTPLFTRIFTTSDYGILTELQSYSVFLVVILMYGLEVAFFRFSKEYPSGKVFSTAIISLSITSIGFIIGTILFQNSIAEILGYKEHSEYILWFGLIIAVDAFVSIPFAKLRLENKALKFAIIRLINILIIVFLNLYFLVFCPFLHESYPNHFLLNFYKLNYGIEYSFIAQLIASIATLFLLIPEFFKTKFYFDFSIYKKMLKYALPLLIVSLAGTINEMLDRVLLKHLLPDKSTALSLLGIYGANYKLSVLMVLFTQTFMYAAEPFFFSTSDKINAKKMYADIMKYFIILGLFMFLAIMMYIDILKYFNAENFHSGINIVPVLLMANLFLGVIFNLSIWYKLTNLTQYGAIISVIGAFITVISNIILIPLFGIFGSAWATFLCYFSMMLISFFWGRRFFSVPYDIKRIILYFFITLTLYFISIFIKFNSDLIKYFVNSLFLIVFVGFIFKNEKLYLFIKNWNKSNK